MTKHRFNNIYFVLGLIWCVFICGLAIYDAIFSPYSLGWYGAFLVSAFTLIPFILGLASADIESRRLIVNEKQWISVKNKTPGYNDGSFLACWKNKGNPIVPEVMLVCFINMQGNLVITGSCGNERYQNFSYWMPLPKPLEYKEVKRLSKNLLK